MELSEVKVNPISSRVSRSAVTLSSASSGSRFPPNSFNTDFWKRVPGNATWADQRSPTRCARLMNKTCGSPCWIHGWENSSVREWTKLTMCDWEGIGTLRKWVGEGVCWRWFDPYYQGDRRSFGLNLGRRVVVIWTGWNVWQCRE